MFLRIDDNQEGIRLSPAPEGARVHSNESLIEPGFNLLLLYTLHMMLGSATMHTVALRYCPHILLCLSGFAEKLSYHAIVMRTTK